MRFVIKKVLSFNDARRGFTVRYVKIPTLYFRYFRIQLERADVNLYGFHRIGFGMYSLAFMKWRINIIENG